VQQVHAPRVGKPFLGLTAQGERRSDIVDKDHQAIQKILLPQLTSRVQSGWKEHFSCRFNEGSGL